MIKSIELTPHLFRWWCHRSPCWGSSPPPEGCHRWPSLKKEFRRLTEWKIYLITDQILLLKCVNWRAHHEIYTRDNFFFKKHLMFYMSTAKHLLPWWFQLCRLWVWCSCVLSHKDLFSTSLHPPIQPCFGHIKEMTRSKVGEAPAHSTLGFLHPPKPPSVMSTSTDVF